ncbi:MAG TPA: hypothetical protein VMW32_05715 [Bacteroidales bacterium]|nr:hypothetical protein [Bacteroidales bacterium]
MVKRYPHTGKITWKSGGSWGESGTFTEGTPEEKTIECYAEENGHQYRISTGKDDVIWSFKIFMELFDESIPDTARFEFEGKEYIILRLRKYQKHAVIWV